jgi:hypothetical protein
VEIQIKIIGYNMSVLNCSTRGQGKAKDEFCRNIYIYNINLKNVKIAGFMGSTRTYFIRQGSRRFYSPVRGKGHTSGGIGSGHNFLLEFFPSVASRSAKKKITRNFFCLIETSKFNEHFDYCKKVSKLHKLAYTNYSSSFFFR